MTSYLMTPEQWHGRRHDWGRSAGVNMDDCWRCQRNLAVCKSKRTYPDTRSAGDAAREQNIAENWVRPVYPYTCRYCGNLHLTTAKRPRKMKRLRRQQRKYLAEQESMRRAATWAA